jgi:predicted ribosomally synthesized peptide with SipW-like signal peptide
MRRRLAWSAIAVAGLSGLALGGVAMGAFSDSKSSPQTLQAATSWVTEGTGLKAVYRNNTPAFPRDNALTPWLRVNNTSSGGLSLAQTVVRYWFTKDAPSDTVVNVYCDYAWLDCTPTGNVTVRTVAVSPTRPKADMYVEVGFKSTAGTLAAGGTTYDIQLRIHKGDWSNFDETNDYSYTTDSAFVEAPKITVYYKGTLVWGTEP